MLASNYYIPNTDWIDFFNPEAAAAYWKNFAERLVPLGIDAWWQDATEPENDDLAGRMVNAGRWRGDASRRAFRYLENHQLHTVAAECGYHLENHHHALADAEACAWIAREIL